MLLRHHLASTPRPHTPALAPQTDADGGNEGSGDEVAAEVLDIDYGEAHLLTGRPASGGIQAVAVPRPPAARPPPTPLAADNVQALRQHPPAEGERGPQTFDIRLRQSPAILTDSEKAQHQG